MTPTMKKLSAAVLAIVVVIGLSAIWFVRSKESGAVETLPNDTVPVVSPEQQNPAATTTKPEAAASALPATVQAGAVDFNRNQTCFFARKEADALKEASIACESLAGVKEVEKGYEQCRGDKARIDADLQKLAPIVSQCPGTDAQLADAYRASTKAAASQGNPDAQLCYLQSGFGVGTAYSEQDIRDFDRDSKQYVELALQRGDWRIVEILGAGRFTPASGLLPRVAKGDVFTQYQMNRLARLGAVGDYAAHLDRLAGADFRSPERSGSDALTPKQVAEADRLASEMHSRYFANAAPLTERPIPCKRK